MKKFIMMAVMAIVAISANAQKGEYFITPRIGFGYGNISNMGDDIARDNLGGNLGVDFEYMLSDQFGLSAGLEGMYLKSGEETISVEGASVKTYATYGFVNIPILAQYHFGNFAVKAGLQPSFKASAKLHSDHKVLGMSGSEDEDFNNINSFNLSIPVGISYQFSTPIVLDLRCAIPVTKLNKDNNPGGNNKLTTVMLSIGYRF